MATSTSTYDAYECHEYAPQNYGVTLVNTRTGARFQTNPVVCGRQAHAQVTRHGQRSMVFLGITKMSNGGAVVQTEFPTRCDIRSKGHVHTHKFPLPKMVER